MKKRIGLFTGGGDCGGLEAVIRGVVYAADSEGWEVYGIPNGYLGMYNLKKYPGQIITPSLVDNRAKKCGTILGTARVKLQSIKDGFERVAQNLKDENIDILIGSGGDDTSLVLEKLSQEGFKVIWVPKTMDLDVLPYSVGGSTAINKIAENIYDLRTTARSHDRILIAEVFGRYVGHTALYGGVAGQADMILIPEIPVDTDLMYEQIKEKYIQRIKDSDRNKGYCLIVVSEGIKDIKTGEIITNSGEIDHFGHKKLGGAGEYVAELIKDKISKDEEFKKVLDDHGLFIKGVKESVPVNANKITYTVRSGIADAYDATQGQKLGTAAVELAKKELFGNGVSYVESEKIGLTPIGILRKQRSVNLETVALYEKMGYKFGRNKIDYKPEIIKLDSESINRIF